MSADWELQKAIVAALQAEPVLMAAIGGRIKQQASAGETYPYVNVGETQTLPLRAGCVTAFEIFVTLHVWSDQPSFAEVKTISGLIATALDGADLAVSGHHLVSLQHRDTRTLRDPDGKSRHGVVTFTARVQRA